MTQTVKTATQLQQEFIPPYPMTIADTGVKRGIFRRIDHERPLSGQFCPG